MKYKFQFLFPAFLIFILLNVSYAQDEEQIQNVEVNLKLNVSLLYEAAKNLKLKEDAVELIAGKEFGKIISPIIKVPIESIEPFLAVGAVLKYENADQNNFTIALRWSPDSTTWSDWAVVPEETHGDLRTGEFVGDLLFLDKEIKFIQVSIELKRTQNYVSPKLTELKIAFISPGGTSKEKLDEIKKFEPQRYEIEKEFNYDGDKESRQNPERDNLTYPRPPFVTRAGWGSTQPIWTPSVTTVTHLIVHHSAGSNTSSDWPAVVRSIWSYHVNTNGWSDIGYNWLIDANGVIYQGRQWHPNGNEDVVGAHFSGTNGNTMGACVMGTFNSVSPTSNASLSLVRLLAYKASNRNIDPRGVSYHSSSQKTLYNISGHRDGVSPTDCPGNILYSQLPTIRNRVFALLNPPVAVTSSVEGVTETAATLKGVVNPMNSVTQGFFQWGIDSYEYKSADQYIGNGTADVTVGVSISSLIPYTIYNYRIAALNSDTISYGVNREFNSTPKVPDVLQLIYPDAGAEGVEFPVQLKWRKSLGSLTYYLQVSTDSLFNHLIVNDATIRDTVKLLSELDYNTKYFWRLRSENQNGSSNFSPAASFKTIIQLPVKIALYSPADSALIGSDSVLFVWRKGEPEILSYWLEVSKDPSFKSAEVDSSISDSSKLISGIDNGSYWWRVKGKNAAGWGEFSDKRYFNVSIVTLTDPPNADGKVPSDYYLSQNFPNPFNPITTIAFTLQEESYIILKLYDVLGREITELLRGVKQAGSHEIKFDGSALGGLKSGVYFYRLEVHKASGSGRMIFSGTKKLILLK